MILYKSPRKSRPKITIPDNAQKGNWTIYGVILDNSSCLLLEGGGEKGWMEEGRERERWRGREVDMARVFLRPF